MGRNVQDEIPRIFLSVSRLKWPVGWLRASEPVKREKKGEKLALSEFWKDNLVLKFLKYDIIIRLLVGTDN